MNIYLWHLSVRVLTWFNLLQWRADVRNSVGSGRRFIDASSMSGVQVPFAVSGFRQAAFAGVRLVLGLLTQPWTTQERYIDSLFFFWQAGKTINERRVHVLIDLVGYTGGGERANEVFASRPAAIQATSEPLLIRRVFFISWLGPSSLLCAAEICKIPSVLSIRVIPVGFRRTYRRSEF